MDLICNLKGKFCQDWKQNQVHAPSDFALPLPLLARTKITEKEKGSFVQSSFRWTQTCSYLSYLLSIMSWLVYNYLTIPETRQDHFFLLSDGGSHKNNSSHPNQELLCCTSWLKAEPPYFLPRTSLAALLNPTQIKLQIKTLSVLVGTKAGFQDVASLPCGRQWGEEGHTCSPLSCSKALTLWAAKEQAEAPALQPSRAFCLAHPLADRKLILRSSSRMLSSVLEGSLREQNHHFQNMPQCFMWHVADFHVTHMKVISEFMMAFTYQSH